MFHSLPKNDDYLIASYLKYLIFYREKSNFKKRVALKEIDHRKYGNFLCIFAYRSMPLSRCLCVRDMRAPPPQQASV